MAMAARPSRIFAAWATSETWSFPTARGSPRRAPSAATGLFDHTNNPLALAARLTPRTGGPATSFGADAVSDVINFIPRRYFAGMELNVSNQITEQVDGHIFRADLTVGANF